MFGPVWPGACLSHVVHVQYIIRNVHTSKLVHFTEFKGFIALLDFINF
jgi:hypothetical protein